MKRFEKRDFSNILKYQRAISNSEKRNLVIRFVVHRAQNLEVLDLKPAFACVRPISKPRSPLSPNDPVASSSVLEGVHEEGVVQE